MILKGILERPFSAIKRRFSLEARGLKIGEVVIPTAMETEHFLVTGSPGSGKSTLIRHILYQVQKRGQPAIVIDPDCEFVQEFYDEARGDWLLNPFDERCPYWSPGLEIRGPIDSIAIAASLMRGRTEDSWYLYARRLITALLMIDASPAGLLTLVNLTPDKLHEKLKAVNAQSIFDPKAAAQVSAVVGIASTVLEPLTYLPPRSARKWTARAWAKERQGWIFLCSTEAARAAVQALQGVWLDLLIRELLDGEIGHEQTWVLADELVTMGPQPRLEHLLTRGRKRGASVVIGFQNVSQLQAMYGEKPAITITSAPTTKVILRSDETKTAEWASDLIGYHEVERLNMTQMAGLSTYREGVNLSPHRSVEPLVMPDEIKDLKPLNGFLAVAGYGRSRLVIKPRYLDPRVPAFVARETLDPPLVTLATFTDKTAIGREKKRLGAVVQRCTDSTCSAYKNYGGRGIGLREAWYKHAGASDMFVNYLLVTIGLPPADNYSLDRIDNDLDYEPGNLRWNTREGQAANKRKAREHAPTVPA